uniref:Uncharacterized protein n=1 Tax=Panthera leo TaxID=9689 RepID=A0A8C8XSR5_PANLE
RLVHNQPNMGNLLCKFHFPPRHVRCLAVFGPCLPAPHSRDAPKRRYPIRQATCTPLGILPLVNWSNSLKKPVLSAHNSMMFGHSRAKRIPPMGCKFTLPHSLSEKVEEAVETIPSRHLPLSCPSGVEEKVQEDPRKKMEDLVETKGQNGGNRVPHNVGDIPFKCPLETGGLLSSLQCSPAPLDLHPNPPEDGLRENTQQSLMNCCPEGHIVTSSHGPAGTYVRSWCRQHGHHSPFKGCYFQISPRIWNGISLMSPGPLQFEAEVPCKVSSFHQPT